MGVGPGHPVFKAALQGLLRDSGQEDACGSS